MTITQTILSNLIHNETYSRKVIPFIKLEYFTDHYEKVISQEIINFYEQYNSAITLDILAIQISNRSELRDNQLQDIEKYINELTFKTDNEQWLYDNTEKFCKNRAVINAIIDAYDIVEGKHKDKTEDAIPSLLSDALAVSFDSSVGHDYLEDYQERYDFYHRVEEKIPFDLDIFNKITKGGLSKKTLNIILAGTAVGKSLFMCHVAASSLLQNKNVLYITMEMAEERIAERIDANLLNIDISDLHAISKQDYDRKFSAMRVKTQGKLIIKEYPTAAASALHFRALLNELQLKKSFKPDIIFIDTPMSLKVKLVSST